MKKRSLVAALAMLMVSAIVLTSSTYAWFATGTTAQVSGISAEVQNTSGSITISADGTNYSTSLNYDSFAEGTNFKPEKYVPVSFDPTTKDFYSGSIDQGTVESDTSTFGKLVFQPAYATNDSDKFIKLTIYVKADVECDVDITPDVAGTNYNFMYAAIFEDNADNYGIYNKAGIGYQPVTGTTVGIDDPADSIMTSADKDTSGNTYGALGDAVTTTTDPVRVHLDGVNHKTITLYVWAEGNNASCKGNVPKLACPVNINFEKAS